uniref:protein GREB1-like isoform X2 n=1 Tax=Styela clava TaxID=7725 RepID=UPI0019393CB4|nr:protein GREB1-like isoform X2 [Styela clava]
MRSKNSVPVQVILPQTSMGSNHSAPKGAFEEALQSSIEASLRSAGTAPSHVFSSLYHRTRPHSDGNQPGPSSSLSLLPPPDQDNEPIDVKPDIAGLNKEIVRLSRSSSGNTDETNTTSVRTQGESTTSVRGPPPLLLPQAFIRPNTSTPSSNYPQQGNNGNRLMIPRLPTLLPKNLQIEQLKHAQEQVKHFQQIQRWHLLQQRHHQARAVANSLSLPRLPLFNPLIQPALNRNALINPGSSINGVHSLPPQQQQQQESSATMRKQTSPGSPMFRKGFCKGGKDIRLSTLQQENIHIIPYPNEYTLVAMSISPSAPQVMKSPGLYHPPDIPADAMVVVAISVSCLPPNQHELSRPIMAQCIGCGESSLHTFATLSSHINLRTASPSHTNVTMSGVNPLQRHARNFVIRDQAAPHRCMRGLVIPWISGDISPMPSQMPQGMLRPRLGMVMPQRQHLKQRHVGRPPSQQIRPQLLPHSGMVIPHSSKTQPTTSGSSPVLLDSPLSANDSPNQRKLADDWSPVSSGQSEPTSDTLQQSRLDPDWNSTVKLPENLPNYVGRPLILICWEWQHLQSNIPNVNITHAFTKCFEEAMTECHHSAVAPLSREFCYMVTTQYLTSLENHDFPTPAAMSAWLGRSRLMLSSMRQVQLTTAHVVSLARMTISNCMHKIGVVISQISQAHAINECIANLRPGGPTFHIISHINGDTILDLSILLTGHTSRLTREYLLTSDEYFEIIKQTSTSDNLGKINNISSAIKLDTYITEMSSIVFQRSIHDIRTSFLPLSTRNTSSPVLSSTRKYIAPTSPTSADENNNATQIVTSTKDEYVTCIADQLFSKISSLCEDHNKLDSSRFTSVQPYFLLPESEVFKSETINDINKSGFLEEPGLSSSSPSTTDARKLILTVSLKSKQRFNAICEHMKKNHSTLFIIFHLDAHLHCDANSVGSEWRSNLLKESLTNLLVISCTHIPHALLNQNTSISSQNIIFSSKFNQESANISTFVDHCFSSSFKDINHHLTYDLHHEAESVAMSGSDPHFHSSTVCTKILTQSYIAALANVLSSAQVLSNGESYSKDDDQLQNLTSPITTSIVKDLLSSKSGITVLLRIPSESLAKYFVSEISNARGKLKMDNAFEVLLYKSNSKPTVSEYFLQILKMQKGKSYDWIPETLSDIDCIPLLLVYTGKDITSHQMPSTLRYVDLRLIANHSESLNQSAILSELSLAHSSVLASECEINATSAESTDEPPIKKARSDSEGSLQMDTFSEDSGDSSEENKLKWKSLNEKDAEQTTEKTTEVEEYSSSDELPQNEKKINRKRSHQITESSSKSVLENKNLKKDFIIPQIILTKNMHSYVESYIKGTEKFFDLPPHSSCEWSSHSRPIISERLNNVQTADYLRKWTKPLPGHPDSLDPDRTIPVLNNPRNILSVISPRTNIALACCIFMKKMNRMLLKMLQVEVYDNKSSSVIKPCYPVPNLDILPQWPVHTTILDMEYDASIKNSSSLNASPITNGVQDFTDVGIDASEISTAACTAGKSRSYDIKHRTCDLCKSSDDSQMTSVHKMLIPKRGLNSNSICDSTIELEISFVVPASTQHHFVFQHRDEDPKLSALNLCFKDSVGLKTPVFSIAIHGAKHGLYNLDHTLAIEDVEMSEDEAKASEPLHIIVIKNCDLDEFLTTWAGKTLMVLPESFDDLGIGSMKYAVQCAMQHSILVRQEQHNVFEEGSSTGDVWPFALLLDDNVVVWTTCNSVVSSTDGHSEIVNWRNISLYDVLKRIEAIPYVERYSAIGLRPWSCDMKPTKCEEEFTGDVVSSGFSKCHLTSCVAINALTTEDELFDCSRFLDVDIDWCLRLAAADRPLFRFNDIAVATKVISSKSKNKIATVDCDDPQSLVSLADFDFTPIPRHPNLLLEVYLSKLGHTVFPKAKGNSRHPVLVVDRYVSLGSEVFVEFTSSRPDALQWSVNTEKSYCGLLLFCQSTEISPEFLQQYKFTKGATVCVVGRDRSSLRQTVLHLHLENNWHFRLSDEYQTTNETGKRKPLFYLTGVARSSR